jgi:hypothetical protein
MLTLLSVLNSDTVYSDRFIEFLRNWLLLSSRSRNEGSIVLSTIDAYSELVFSDSSPRMMLPTTIWLSSITYSYEKFANLRSDLRMESLDLMR